jgi:hypothetical protein
VDFPYLICIFCVGEITSMISLEKTTGGKLLVTHFPLVPSSRRVMGAPIHLLWESCHVRLVRVGNQRAKPPLSVRVAPVAGGSSPFMFFGLPCMIPCVVHEWPPIHLCDCTSYRVLHIDSLILPFHSLLHAGTTVPFFAFSFLTA